MVTPEAFRNSLSSESMLLIELEGILGVMGGESGQAVLGTMDRLPATVERVFIGILWIP